MPGTHVEFKVSKTELLCDESRVQLEMSVELTRLRKEVEEEIKGRALSVGEFRGVVHSIDNANIVVRNEETGEQKTLPKTRTRIRHVLGDVTTRK